MTQIIDSNPKPITVEAFRFVHLKSPNLYTGKHDTANFIQHPDPTRSAILQNQISNSGTAVASAFTPYSSLAEIRQLNSDLYSFIFWLKDNRGRLEPVSLAEQMTNLSPLAEQQRLDVWENLFYQTQTDSTPVLVEGLVRLLQADHFLNYYTGVVATADGNENFPIVELQKAAKASIMIPQELFDTPQALPQQSATGLDMQSKTILSDQLEVAIKSHQVALRTVAVEEIRAAENKYSHEYQEDYQAALEAYEASLSSSSTTDGTESTTSNTTSDASTVDEPGTSNSTTDVTPFTFSPANTWDDAYLQNHISSDSLRLFQHIKTNEHRHIADTRTVMEQSIGALNSQKYRLLKKNSSKTLIHNGVRIPLRNRPLNNAYVFKAVPVEGRTDHYSLYVTQYFEKSATKVTKIDATLSTANGVYNASTQTPVFETNQYVTLQLFPDGILLPEGASNFSVTGTFETEDAAFNNQFNYQNVAANKSSAHSSRVGNVLGQSIPVPNIFGVMGVKVAEFKKVNQTLCCYTEGEVSHIENILAREYKERETRDLIRSELTTEETREREAEKLSDTSTTERHEMQSEISLVLEEDKSNNASASASAGGSYSFGTGSVNFSANGSLNTSSSSSSSSNFSESEAYAKEVTQRAMKRLVEKTTYKRTSKMIREFEEKNKHGFDNREGDKHVTGVYRWVDKIYRNDLVNYGKRLMYEFTLPEPAKNYKHLLMKNIEKDQVDACTTVVLTEPLSPTDKGINRYFDITEHNFDDLVAYYGLDIEEYRPRFIKIGRSFSENFYQTGAKADDGPLHSAKDFDLELPDDYECIAFDCRLKAVRHGKNEAIRGHLLVGNHSYYFTDENVRAFTRYSNAFSPVEKYLPIALAGEDIGTFAMTITAICEIKSDAFDEFRAQFFAAMWASYKEMKQAYEDAVYETCLRKQQDAAANQDKDQPNYSMPSAMARAVEKREIKRLIIEQIMRRYYSTLGNANFPIGFDYYQPDPCNNTLNLMAGTTFYKNQLKYIRFLEEAFEWEIMAYTFLPYYWADENDWGELLSIEANADHVFLAFLKAGMVDVTLPVKPGLEKSVAFLLETGLLWRGDGFVLSGQDDLYPAIEENLQIEVDAQGNEIEYDNAGNPIPKIEATWETRIPSTLTIVQDYSNPLADEGLPCFCEKDKTKAIGFSPLGEYNILKGKTTV